MTEEEFFKEHENDIITMDIFNHLRPQIVKLNETKNIIEFIDKAYKDGLITLDIANKLKQEKENRQLAKENSKAKFNENLEINDTLSSEELSKEDSIAFKTMLLLERNSKNTSLITIILLIQFSISILGAIIFLASSGSWF